MGNMNTQLGPLNCTGSLWTASFGGQTYRVEERCFVLSPEGVFEDRGYDAEPQYQLASEAEAVAVRQLAAEDAGMQARRLDTATRASEGNAALETVLLLSMAYEDGEPDLEEFKGHPGIKFGQAGHNSSHGFYAGADEEGKCYYLSIDFYEHYQGSEGAGLSLRAVESFAEIGYWGHY